MSFYNRRADELRRWGRARAEYGRFLAGRLDKRALLRRAWGLARDGARRFGGTVRAYLAEALRQSWAEAKARLAVARGMAEDRAAMGWASRDPAAIEERFALTVVGLLALREAEAARATA